LALCIGVFVVTLNVFYSRRTHSCLALNSLPEDSMMYHGHNEDIGDHETT